jgi:hypothetical protein
MYTSIWLPPQSRYRTFSSPSQVPLFCFYLIPSSEATTIQVSLLQIIFKLYVTGSICSFYCWIALHCIHIHNLLACPSGDRFGLFLVYGCCEKICVFFQWACAISTSSMWEFQFLCVLVNIWYCQLFSAFYWVWNGSSVWFFICISWWTMCLFFLWSIFQGFVQFLKLWLIC